MFLGLSMDLVVFIIKAKISGYASGGEGRERNFDDGSRGFEFEANGFKYIDRYYGFNPFSGSECIYDAGNSLIWIMNYYGEILSSYSDPKAIYSFLREAMSLVTPSYPFRGPEKFTKGNLTYQNQQKGVIQHFNGIESIYDCDEKIYYLHYHGGKMMKET